MTTTATTTFDGIDEYLTLEGALEALAALTTTTWEMDELFDALVRFSLQVHAVTPSDAVVCVRSVEVNGSRKMLPVPNIGHRFALLLTHQVRELGNNHPKILTQLPALLPGDPDYKTWSEVKAERESGRAKSRERSPFVSAWGPTGEWMGESNLYAFARLFPISLADLRLPRHTIAELVSKWDDPKARATIRRFEPDLSPAPTKLSAPKLPEAEAVAEPYTIESRAGRPISKPRVKWDQYRLRQVLDESREPGATHEKLAEKHGVSRQRIATLLRQAENLFGVKKASPFDALGRLKRK